MNATSHHVILYGLTTCMHCRLAVDFLNESQIPFECVYVDKFEGQDRSNLLAKVRGYNPRISFPTIVVDEGANVIVGFQPDAIKECLL